MLFYGYDSKQANNKRLLRLYTTSDFTESILIDPDDVKLIMKVKRGTT